MLIEKDKIKVGIHSEPNHPDDILCVVLLEKEYGEENVQVVRTRDLEILKTCDYILDVGGKDEIVRDKDGNIVQVWLDHHQIDSEYETNGVKKAACSKLADFLYSDVNKFLLKELHRILIDPVAASDNGQDLVVGQNLLNFVSLMVEQDWRKEPNAEESLKRFNKTKEMVSNIVDGVVERISGLVTGRNIVCDILKNIGEREYIVLDRYIPKYIWNNILLEYNKAHNNRIKAVVFPTTHLAWDGVMVHKDRNTFECIKNYPKNWLGLRDEELSKVSGISGAIFCHTAGFFFEGKTKESVIEAVEKVLEVGD